MDATGSLFKADAIDKTPVQAVPDPTQITLPHLFLYHTLNIRHDITSEKFIAGARSLGIAKDDAVQIYTQIRYALESAFYVLKYGVFSTHPQVLKQTGLITEEVKAAAVVLCGCDGVVRDSKGLIAYTHHLPSAKTRRAHPSLFVIDDAFVPMRHLQIGKPRMPGVRQISRNVVDELLNLEKGVTGIRRILKMDLTPPATMAPPHRAQRDKAGRLAFSRVSP